MHARAFVVSALGLIVFALLASADATEPNVIFLPNSGANPSVPPQPAYEYPAVASPVVVPANLVAAAAPPTQTATVVSDPSTGGYRVVISDGRTVTSVPVTVTAPVATQAPIVRNADPRYYVVPPQDEGGNGWRVIFFVLICASVYLGIGYYLNTKHKNLRGIAALPHIEFWIQLPGLAADGVEHTKRWVLTSWARGRPAHCFNLDHDLGSAYERVQGGTTSSLSGQGSSTHINMDLGSDEETEYTRAMLGAERQK